MLVLIMIKERNAAADCSKYAESGTYDAQNAEAYDKYPQCGFR